MLLATICQELAEWPSVPCFLLGDLNAEPESAPSVASMVRSGAWHDLGRIASVWPGGSASQPTALGHGAKKDTRIAVALVNDAGLSITRGFSVGEAGVFDVHRPLHIQVARRPHSHSVL